MCAQPQGFYGEADFIFCALAILCPSGQFSAIDEATPVARGCAYWLTRAEPVLSLSKERACSQADKKNSRAEAPKEQKHR